MLLKTPTKPHLRQPKPNESEFRYLEKSTSEHSCFIRSKLNRYFSNISDQKSQKELKSRFKNDFTSAYFELLIHQLFYNKGFLLTDHPKVPNSIHRPDYLVAKDGDSFYVECKEFRDLSDEQKDINISKNNILYHLSNLKSSYYLYNIDKFVLSDPKLPDLSNFYSDLQSIMRTSPNVDSDEDNYVHAKPTFKSESLDIRLNLSLRHDWQEGIEEDELLGWYMGNTRFEFSAKSLKRGIVDKMLKYGQTDKPLLVTINVDSVWFSKRIEFEEILYRRAIHVIDQVNNREYTEYEESGLFFELEARIPHVIGVLVVFLGNVYNSQAEYYFYKNPKFKGSVNTLVEFENTSYNNNMFEYDENVKIQPLLE